MDSTVWKPVVGHEGLYEVSEHGQVRRSAGGRNTYPGKLLQAHASKGYLFVRLYGAGKPQNRYIHRLVAIAFLGQPEGLEVCHNDGDRTNNHLDNLRWDTRSANTKDAVRHGTNFAAAKTHCPAGHAYDEKNTSVSTDGSRRCKECRRIRAITHRRANGSTAPGQRTHCRRGHEMDEANTLNRQHARACKACLKLGEKDRNARYRAKRKASLNG